MTDLRNTPKTFQSNSADATRALGIDFAKHLKNGSLVCLYGDLGAGKTTFAKGLGKGLGLNEGIIKSPTFVFLKTYKGKNNRLHHFDCYRISKPEEICNEIFETFERKDGIVVIEWAEKIKEILPDDRVDIYFEHISPEQRKITVYA